MPFTIDPEAGAILGAMAAGMPDPPPPPPAVGDVETRRTTVGPGLTAIVQASFPIKDSSVTQKDFYATSTDGHKVLLRWYSKAASSPGPAVLFTHAGGMIIGQVSDFDGTVHNYVSKTGVSFLSVEYRLSPEVQYPKALEDSYAGLVWLHEHAAELNVDRRRIAVLGESAGGNLAASLCIYARDKRGPAIAKQFLIYPMLDDNTVTVDANIRPFLTWSEADAVTGWDAYLGKGKRGTGSVAATAAPSRLKDATGLPPLYLDVGELDMFRDENIAYAVKFAQAGVSAELHVYPGMPHGFDMLAAGAQVSQEAMARRMNAIKSIPTIDSAKL
jgi:acetyl esterase/lipase